MQTIDESPPPEEAWNNCSDPEGMWAYRLFSGLTASQAKRRFAEHPVGSMENITHMPPVPLMYYFRAFAEYVLSPDDLDTAADAASSLLNFSLSMLKKKGKEVGFLFPLLKVIAPRVAELQGKYDAPEEIYGDFKQVADEIQKHIAILEGNYDM